MKMGRIVPMLPVKDINRSIDFYQRLGFRVEQHRDDWGWAMLQMDDCRIMLDQSIHKHDALPREAVLYLYPAAITEYHQQVRGNGLEIPDLDTTFYGLTEFRLSDPDGNQLWVGQASPVDQQM